MFELGLGLFSEPWLVGMWGLFLFELIEGNTITRGQFQRTLRRSRGARGYESDDGSRLKAELRRASPKTRCFRDLPLDLDRRRLNP